MPTATTATASKARISTGQSAMRKGLAEALGTAFLTMIGAGTVTATNTLVGKHLAEADLGVIALGFGFAIAVSIYSLGRISGAHLNPAVTLAMLATRRIDLGLASIYVVTQLIGAVAGALGIIAIFGTGAATQTSLGVTSFAATTPAIQAAGAEAICTFVFVFVIAAMAVDPRAPTGWAGLVIGLTLAAIIMFAGPITGASLNPARSLGPVLVQALFGGKVDWSQYWVYVVGPIVGAVAGVFAYDFIGQPRRAGRG